MEGAMERMDEQEKGIAIPEGLPCSVLSFPPLFMNY